MNILNNPKLETNFSLHEFVCKCGCKSVKFDMQVIRLLQKIRNHFNRPVTINSAYRCPTHNKKVGGVDNSQHMQGIACDISIKGVHPLEVARYAVDISFTGVGVYTHNGNLFTHVDTRKKVTYWVDIQGTTKTRGVKEL